MVGHDGGLALDRLAGAEVEVDRHHVGGCGAVEFDDAVSDLPAGAEDVTGHRGRGVPGLTVTGVVRKQRPAVVERQQGGDVIPQRPTLHTVDKKVGG
ncbi:hypothetical protein AB0D04_11400 [Streptomyces sp. NPDC048483]|uniref:hypothetical protein n=1 Tax=Streptomyces sp. NPDC048483 TaxID=3154927 RepID=UPI003446F07B